MKLRHLIIVGSIAVALLVGLIVFYEFRIHRIRKVEYSRGKADAMLVENQKIIDKINKSVTELEIKTKEYYEVYERYTEITERIGNKIDNFIDTIGSLDNNIRRLQSIWSDQKD